MRDANLEYERLSKAGFKKKEKWSEETNRGTWKRTLIFVERLRERDIQSRSIS